MAGVNKVILIGNLGKDPEIRAMESGSKVANFSVATTESYKNKNGEKVDQTEWHNVVFWGPVADVIERYLKKGSKVYIEGKLRTRSYEQEGVKKYTTEVWGQNMTMLDSANRTSEPSTAGYQGEKSQASQATSAPVGIQDDADDDLPF